MAINYHHVSAHILLPNSVWLAGIMYGAMCIRLTFPINLPAQLSLSFFVCLRGFARSSSESFEVIRFLVTEPNAHRLPSGQISWGNTLELVGLSLLVNKHKFVSSARFREFPGGTQYTTKHSRIFYTESVGAKQSVEGKSYTRVIWLSPPQAN